MEKATFLEEYLAVPAFEWCFGDKITVSGLEHIPPDGSIIISNHLAIITDAYCINYGLLRAGFPSAHIGAGDNLFRHPALAGFLNIVKAVEVPRDNAGKTAIVNLSQRIEDIVNNNEYMWLSQREGRAKGGNHVTDMKVLKMLRLASRERMDVYSRRTPIIPCSVSYEVIPDAKVMAEQHVTKEKGASPAWSDFVSSVHGFTQLLGRVHVAFSSVVSADTNTELAQRIDNAIKSSYRIWPSTLAGYYARHFGVAIAREYLIPRLPKEEQRLVAQFFERVPTFADFSADLTPTLERTYFELYAGPLLKREKK